MRPPHYTGENLRFQVRHAPLRYRFNEAPALHGGKPVRMGVGGDPRQELQ